METAIKNELTDILRHEPSRGEILEILKTVKETGKSIIEVAQDMGCLEILMVMQDGRLDSGVVGGQYESLEHYRAIHPFRKLVLLSTPKIKEHESK